MTGTAPTSETPTSTLPELDREVLNGLTRAAFQADAYFGTDVTLTEADRAQVGLACSRADQKLAPCLDTEEWKAFQTLVQEGNNKGVLMSFKTHEGTNVPMWCTDGGDTAIVGKILLPDGRAAIQVPTGIFNTFHWQRTVESLRRTATLSDEMLKGRATKSFGENLVSLAQLVKSEA